MREKQNLAGTISLLLAAMLSMCALRAISHPNNASDEVASALPKKLALSTHDSVQRWPKPIRAPPGAPNIVLILLDDIGFADTSAFGGLAQTPSLEELALS